MARMGARLSGRNSGQSRRLPPFFPRRQFETLAMARHPRTPAHTDVPAKYTPLVLSRPGKQITIFVRQEDIRDVTELVAKANKCVLMTTDEARQQHLASLHTAYRAGEVAEKERRDPKRRNTERDDEIVRLRDVEKKAFGEIGKLLSQMNKEWRSKDGKQLTRDAVERAYYRRKGH
jgi:hypothetical protein